MNDIEKAIELFENCDTVTFTVTGCGEESYNTFEFQNTIEVLRKQMPKLIDYSELNYSRLPVAKCPKCNSKTININRLLSSAKYCPDCGQRLDWEVENGTM